MPQLPGEVLLCTLFADVHYYFASPSQRPAHHRFDRRSYLYLYHDALHRRGRVEIANNAGTPDQDAFIGYLDPAQVDYSYNQPTLFTLTAVHANPNDISQWHIPAYDLSNQMKYMYKIHTIDVYLWKTDDASLLVDSLKRVLPETQLRLTDIPPELAHASDRGGMSAMSPVVAQLETVAISSPNPYARSGSVGTTHTSHSHYQTQQPVQQPATASPVYSDSSRQQQSYTPIAAYNPAAPVAPEARAHREKTPPPPDAGQGNGLAAAERYEAHPPPHQATIAPPQQRQMSFGPQAGGPSFSGPPTIAHAEPPSFALPPTQPTFAGPPTQAVEDLENEPPSAPSPPYQPSHVPGQQGQQFSYGSHAATSINHNIHNIAYIPDTPGSKKAKAQPVIQPAPAAAGPGQQAATGKFEQRFEGLEQRGKKLEGKLNRLFKKLDST